MVANHQNSWGNFGQQIDGWIMALRTSVVDPWRLKTAPGCTLSSSLRGAQKRCWNFQGWGKRAWQWAFWAFKRKTTRHGRQAESWHHLISKVLYLDTLSLWRIPSFFRDGRWRFFAHDSCRSYLVFAVRKQRSHREKDNVEPATHFRIFHNEVAVFGDQSNFIVEWEKEFMAGHGIRKLGGGFKHSLFSPVPGEDSQFD